MLTSSAAFARRDEEEEEDEGIILVMDGIECKRKEDVLRSALLPVLVDFARNALGCSVPSL
jgi:hypothetical protein